MLFLKSKVVRFLRAETEAVRKLQKFMAGDGIPQVLTSDNGKEVISKHLTGFALQIKSSRAFKCLKLLNGIEWLKKQTGL